MQRALKEDCDTVEGEPARKDIDYFLDGELTAWLG